MKNRICQGRKRQWLEHFYMQDQKLVKITVNSKPIGKNLQELPDKGDCIEDEIGYSRKFTPWREQ